ncbi:hypothetical protein Drorol1_Dr00004120 [Drosera rotundifolia]
MIIIHSQNKLFDYIKMHITVGLALKYQIDGLKKQKASSRTPTKNSQESKAPIGVWFQIFLCPHRTASWLLSLIFTAFPLSNVPLGSIPSCNTRFQDCARQLIKPLSHRIWSTT